MALNKFKIYSQLLSMGWFFGQVQDAWSGPLLWSEWLSSSSNATPYRIIQIHIIITHIKGLVVCKGLIIFSTVYLINNVYRIKPRNQFFAKNLFIYNKCIGKFL